MPAPDGSRRLQHTQEAPVAVGASGQGHGPGNGNPSAFDVGGALCLPSCLQVNAAQSRSQRHKATVMGLASGSKPHTGRWPPTAVAQPSPTSARPLHTVAAGRQNAGLKASAAAAVQRTAGGWAGGAGSKSRSAQQTPAAAAAAPAAGAQGEPPSSSRRLETRISLATLLSTPPPPRATSPPLTGGGRPRQSPAGAMGSSQGCSRQSGRHRRGWVHAGAALASSRASPASRPGDGRNPRPPGQARPGSAGGVASSGARREPPAGKAPAVGEASQAEELPAEASSLAVLPATTVAEAEAGWQQGQQQQQQGAGPGAAVTQPGGGDEAQVGVSEPHPAAAAASPPAASPSTRDGGFLAPLAALSPVRKPLPIRPLSPLPTDQLQLAAGSPPGHPPPRSDRKRGVPEAGLVSPPAAKKISPNTSRRLSRTGQALEAGGAQQQQQQGSEAAKGSEEARAAPLSAGELPSRGSSRPTSRGGSRPTSRGGSRPASRDSSRPASRDSSRPASRDRSRPSSWDSSRPTSRGGSSPAAQASAGKTRSEGASGRGSLAALAGPDQAAQGRVPLSPSEGGTGPWAGPSSSSAAEAEAGAVPAVGRQQPAEQDGEPTWAAGGWQGPAGAEGGQALRRHSGQPADRAVVLAVDGAAAEEEPRGGLPSSSAGAAEQDGLELLPQSSPTPAASSAAFHVGRPPRPVRTAPGPPVGPLAATTTAPVRPAPQHHGPAPLSVAERPGPSPAGSLRPQPTPPLSARRPPQPSSAGALVREHPLWGALLSSAPSMASLTAGQLLERLRQGLMVSVPGCGCVAVCCVTAGLSMAAAVETSLMVMVGCADLLGTPCWDPLPCRCTSCSSETLLCFCCCCC